MGPHPVYWSDPRLHYGGGAGLLDRCQRALPSCPLGAPWYICAKQRSADPTKTTLSQNYNIGCGSTSRLWPEVARACAICRLAEGLPGHHIGALSIGPV